MNKRRHRLPCILKLALVLGALAGLLASPEPARAQIATTLLQFTNVWKYDQSGLELGTAWRTNDYDDSAWAQGPGLLGFEDVQQPYTTHAPINTQLTVSSTVTTFYFRTTFTFPGPTNGLSLIATNLLDDGCAIYLNGLRAGGVRAPATYNASTLFAGPTSEGQLDVVTLTNLDALRAGENLIAVEVHQAANNSADIMWGMKLLAFQATSLLITNSPRSQTVTVGQTVALTAGVSGGPAFYRWEKDGVPQASTGNTLNITNAQPANAGDYRVVVTNSVSAVTSSVATLTVLADITGPKLLAAIGNNSQPGGSPFGSNTINVIYSEVVNAASVRSVANYTLTRRGATNTVPILNILYSAQLGALLTVDATDPDWTPGGDYVLTVNNVLDTRGNVIAPGSQAAVGWPRNHDLLAGDAEWNFHASAIFEPGIYDEDWTGTNYLESLWWGQGRGIFCGGPAVPLSCFGATTQTEIGYQPEPSLFRTTFQWPAEPGSSALLRISLAADDGLVLYLNGLPIFWNNVSTTVTKVSAATLAVASVAEAACMTNGFVAVTNLLPGVNWIAAAVPQAAANGSDTIFGLRLTATTIVTPALPDAPFPRLEITALGADAARLTWAGGGYALESTTNLNLGGASHPLGPWQQVTNMSNPYTNSLAGAARFFRLKK